MPEKDYSQVVILSGKGGTGKTTLSAAIVSLLENKTVIDCDVDAANLHLVLNPDIQNTYSFSGGKKAVINKDLCTECGLCETLCRFDAISNNKINSADCEGCGLCYRACPSKAIDFNQEVTGNYFGGTIADESKLYFARLHPGEGNSGKLVTELKKKAIQNISPETKWIVIDGPPGIGCPVNASMAAADFAIIVTEPTISGIHDMKRIAILLSRFKINFGIVINKYDLNENLTFKIFKYADSERIPVLGTIPFDKEFINVLISGRNIVDVNSKIREDILMIIKQIKLQINLLFN